MLEPCTAPSEDSPRLCCEWPPWEHADVTWEEASTKPTLLAWVATLWQPKKFQECQRGQSCALASSLTWELSALSINAHLRREQMVPTTTHQLNMAHGKHCSLAWRWEFFSLSFTSYIFKFVHITTCHSCNYKKKFVCFIEFFSSYYRF